MKLYVSNEVMQATTGCKKGFSCLGGKRKDQCKIGTCIDGENHFIVCLNEINCSYQRSYGEEFICDCLYAKRYTTSTRYKCRPTISFTQKDRVMAGVKQQFTITAFDNAFKLIHRR